MAPRQSGLDNLGHGKDWAQIYVFTKSAPAGPHYWTLESANILNMCDALDLRGSGENIGGMTASGWYSLLILDMIYVLQKLNVTEALLENEFAIFTIGLRILGMLRVATRRAGRHELVLRGHLPVPLPEHFMPASFVFSLGCSFVDHCEGQTGRFLAWWHEECPAEITVGSIEPGDFVGSGPDGEPI